MPSPTFYIVFLATACGLFYYKKFKNTIYKYFIFYLGVVFITELLNSINFGYFTIYKKSIFNTNPIYNIYTIITFVFYFSFYKKLFKRKENKRYMTIFLGLYLLFTLFDLLVLKTNFKHDFFINNIVFGSTLLVITLILFLVEIINNEKIVFNIKQSFIFWISVGALLFYIGVIPIIISSKYLNFKGLYHVILTPLNVIMYGSFIIGFIKSDPKYNY